MSAKEINLERWLLGGWVGGWVGVGVYTRTCTRTRTRTQYTLDIHIHIIYIYIYIYIYSRCTYTSILDLHIHWIVTLDRTYARALIFENFFFVPACADEKNAGCFFSFLCAQHRALSRQERISADEKNLYV